jgi:hypothetical protein
LLITLLPTPGWDFSQEYLKAHDSVLLTDQAEYALQVLIEGIPGREELPQHLVLFKGCHEKGIDAAYDEYLSKAAACL